MVELYGQKRTRRDIAASAGSFAQFAGVRLLTLGDGSERGEDEEDAKGPVRACGAVAPGRHAPPPCHSLIGKAAVPRSSSPMARRAIWSISSAIVSGIR